jgi:hypothetical protein
VLGQTFGKICFKICKKCQLFLQIITLKSKHQNINKFHQFKAINQQKVFGFLKKTSFLLDANHICLCSVQSWPETTILDR